jgi:hypothetical protein
VGFLVGDAELLDCLVSDVVEQVEPRSTLLPSSRLKLISEELVQSKNRAVSDDGVPEAVELVADRVGDSDLVEPLLDEVAEELCEPWS